MAAIAETPAMMMETAPKTEGNHCRASLWIYVLLMDAVMITLTRQRKGNLEFPLTLKVTGSSIWVYEKFN